MHPEEVTRGLQVNPVGDLKKNAVIYGNYMSYLGKFDDLPCNHRDKYAGYICERAVSCTKDEKGRSL